MLFFVFAFFYVHFFIIFFPQFFKFGFVFRFPEICGKVGTVEFKSESVRYGDYAAFYVVNNERQPRKPLEKVRREQLRYVVIGRISCVNNPVFRFFFQPIRRNIGRLFRLKQAQFSFFAKLRLLFCSLTPQNGWRSKQIALFFSILRGFSCFPLLKCSILFTTAKRHIDSKAK